MHTYIWTCVDIYTVLTHIYIYLYRKWCTFEIQSIFPHIQNRIFFFVLFLLHIRPHCDQTRCLCHGPPTLLNEASVPAPFEVKSTRFSEFSTWFHRHIDSHRQNIYINICGTVCYTGGEKTQGTFNQVFGQNHHGFYWVQLVWIRDWKNKNKKKSNLHHELTNK